MPAQPSTLPNQESKREPEQDLFTWVAPARPFKRRDRNFYITIIAIAAVCGLVLFLVDGWIPVVLIVSLVFLFYVLSTVEPENIEYKITNQGVKIAGSRTDWELTRRFWFTKRFDSEVLVIETATLPGRLEFVIKPESKAQIQEAISKHIIFEEAPASFLDTAANWFAKRMPQG